MCPNNTEVRIYARSGDSWVLEQTLDEHDKVVTGIDWAPNTNRIVTCGQDRNAYVWTHKDGVWKPTLVILRINRAATHVKWSPHEDKFAVGSGAKCVSICYFESENDWWVSKHIRKHDSTVLDIAWHPENVLLATASSDTNCRVFSTFIKGVDKRPTSTPFGTKLPFGSLQGTYESSGWAHSCDWSPSGNQLAFVGHDSTMTVIDLNNGAPGDFQICRVKELPFLEVRFLDEQRIVAAGHSCYPVLFTNNGGQWTYDRNLDAKKEATKKKASGTRAAFAMFQNKVDKGQDKAVANLETKHKNSITCLQFAHDGKLSTSALDGKIVFWDV